MAITPEKIMILNKFMELKRSFLFSELGQLFFKNETIVFKMKPKNFNALEQEYLENKKNG